MAPETEPLDVLTIGEMVVDFISVEKTDTRSNASTFERHLGGSPANVAVYVAKFGGRSAIITKLGFDYFGEYVEDQLQHHGVNTEAVSRTDEASTTNAFVTHTVSVPDFQVNRGADALLRVRQVNEELISRTRIVHTSAFALSKDPQRLAVILTRSGDVVTVSDNGNVERVGPLPKVEISNVTGAAFWSALLMAHLEGKDWPEAVRFAHQVASLKLRVEGHVERMIDRECFYAGLKSAVQQTP
jgi:sugar/nucleoside kinase (ribokinase family)